MQPPTCRCIDTVLPSTELRQFNKAAATGVQVAVTDSEKEPPCGKPLNHFVELLTICVVVASSTNTGLLSLNQIAYDMRVHAQGMYFHQPGEVTQAPCIKPTRIIQFADCKELMKASTDAM